MPDVHPSALPFTIAYTATISAPVTVIAPPTSRLRPCAALPLVPGISRNVRNTTAIPIGILTRKIQCQLIVSVRTPPSTTPMLPPPEATNPKRPIAFARSAGSVKSASISESETAEATAPPMPCTARAVTSMPCEVERPQRSEASVKSPIPNRNRRRWPYRSPSRPPRSSRPPNVSVYAFTTHASDDSLNPRSSRIDGSATFTIVASSTIMRLAAQSV